MVTVAIHQPNYLPWLGYFDKILRSDVFVFLDHVAMSRGSYTQRVEVLVQGRPAWLTVPVRKSGRMGQPIAATEVDDHGAGWRRRHLATLRQQYGKHPAFAEVFPVLEEGLLGPWQTLSDLNVHLVSEIAVRLGAGCRFVRSGTLPLEDVGRDEMLACVTRVVGGDAYLHGRGGEKYQDEAVFRAYGVRPVPQRFALPSYPQRGATGFVPGLSIVDALFNLGYAQTARMLADARTAAAAGEMEPA